MIVMVRALKNKVLYLWPGSLDSSASVYETVADEQYKGVRTQVLELAVNGDCPLYCFIISCVCV